MHRSPNSRRTRSGGAHRSTPPHQSCSTTVPRAASPTCGGCPPSPRREEDAMSKAMMMIACVAALIVGAGSARAQSVDCNFNPPAPPDPIPPGYDWTPIAQAFCEQLANCGYPDPACVSNYLYAVANYPAPSGSGSEGVDSEGGSDQLVCEDSVEYQNGETTCCAPSCSGKACGADDGCGQPCC